MKTHRNRLYKSKNKGDNKLDLDSDKIKGLNMKKNNASNSKGRGNRMNIDKLKLFLICLVVTLATYQTNKAFFDDKILQRNNDSNTIIKNELNWYADIADLDNLKKRSEKIKELCYPGMEEVCQCENPMIGKGREGQRHWLKTMRENSDSVATVKDGVDVIFYGDSITEGWKGTSYGFANGRKSENLAVFESLFNADKGGKFNGIPMGISGDRSPDLLWRLQHGELPISLKPAVFWVLIGTNDMGWAWCSPEVALVGILRVVEELRSKRPGSQIVINGLLPRSFDTKGYVMKAGKIKNTILPSLWKDIQAINNQLEEYSRTRDDVYYFDATDIFLVNGDDMDLTKENDLRIDENLMNDFVHPSHIGYRLWGDRIVKKLEELMKN